MRGPRVRIVQEEEREKKETSAKAERVETRWSREKRVRRKKFLQQAHIPSEEGGPR